MTRTNTLAASTIPLPRPAWLPEHVWPFEMFGLRTADSVLAVTDVGRGPVLLLVHTGTWSIIWRDLITRLAAEFRCVCFDAPGTGRSTLLPRTSVTLANASRAVRAVIEALDLRDLTLVAHDLGGPAGLAAIAQTPERIRGIVAMNTFGWRPHGPVLRGMLALMGSGLMRELDVLTEFLPRISSTSFGVGRHMDADSRAAFRAGMSQEARRAFHHYMRDARQSDALYEQISSALAGPFARLPLLTIFGERNDPFRFQRQWKRLFPGALQVVVKKGNHFPMCDAPDLVSQTIRVWHRDYVAA